MVGVSIIPVLGSILQYSCILYISVELSNFQWFIINSILFGRCSMALIHSRISQVHYEESSSFGALGSFYSIHYNSKLNHNFTVTRSIRHDVSVSEASSDANIEPTWLFHGQWCLTYFLMFYPSVYNLLIWEAELFVKLLEIYNN